ncbi:unnamed protein product, partial [Mesorhabditis spiculigera]
MVSTTPRPSTPARREEIPQEPPKKVEPTNKGSGRSGKSQPEHTTMGLPTASQVVAKPVGKETREKRMEKCDLKKLEVVVERHKKNRETLMASRVQPKKRASVGCKKA